MTEPAGDPEQPSSGFHVRLKNFEGPFDLLLALISQHRMDVTEVALHRVTDDFIAHMKSAGKDLSLEQATHFLLVAATLLDLKAVRLLPSAEVTDPEDLELLEARDLLFARLLQYRAFKVVAGIMRELEAAAMHRYPCSVGLEERYLNLMPEVRLGVTPQEFAEIAAAAMRPRPVPRVDIGHLHHPKVSVRAHARRIMDMLHRHPRASFAELVRDCETQLDVVASFMGLLNLFRDKLVEFEQPEPLEELVVLLSPEGAA